MLKEEALKKQKQAELRLAEINAKRLQVEQARSQKMVIHLIFNVILYYVIVFCIYLKINLNQLIILKSYYYFSNKLK